MANKFMEKWNFPNTCGAMDGKHVACKAPANTGSQYYNYKGHFSDILFAMLDAEYKFLWADVSARGLASDAQNFNASELKACIEDNR